MPQRILATGSGPRAADPGRTTRPATARSKPCVHSRPLNVPERMRSTAPARRRLSWLLPPSKSTGLASRAGRRRCAGGRGATCARVRTSPPGCHRVQPKRKMGLGRRPHGRPRRHAVRGAVGLGAPARSRRRCGPHPRSDRSGRAACQTEISRMPYLDPAMKAISTCTETSPPASDSHPVRALAGAGTRGKPPTRRTSTSPALNSPTTAMRSPSRRLVRRMEASAQATPPCGAPNWCTAPEPDGQRRQPRTQESASRSPTMTKQPREASAGCAVYSRPPEC